MTGPRDEHGRFTRSVCPDPHCSGKLVWQDPGPADRRGYFCDGLTDHGDDRADLVPCDYHAPAPYGPSSQTLRRWEAERAKINHRAIAHGTALIEASLRDTTP